MDVSVDIGGNLTSLVERLAQQIGVTAEQVFPWYVQQAYIEGCVFLILFAAILVLAISLFTWGAFRFDKEGFGNALPSASFFLLLAGGLMLFGLLMSAATGLSSAITKVANPNYHAMKMLTRDIGKLRGAKD